MAEPRETPRQTKSIAARAAIVISAAFFGLPASAAIDSPNPCPASERATLVVKSSKLAPESIVSHDVSFITTSQDAKTSDDAELVNSTTLLAPRAEAAIRDAFEESESVESPAVAIDPVVSEDVEEEKNGTTMITRLPGVNNDDLSRFRKQMFRRDI